MTTVDLPGLVERLRSLLSGGERCLVGLVGPPGAGKSALAVELVDAIGHGVVVPMDGFHRRHAELVARGIVDRKGAPDTFDAAGFVALLVRLRAPASGDSAYPRGQVLAPDYSIAVPGDESLVVVEGNYLLLDVPPWDGVRQLLDLVVYLDADPERRRRGLVDRHVAGGRSAEEAREFVDRSDEANARLVETTRQRADLTLAVD